MAGGAFGGGDGTVGTPYLVEDAADLNAVRGYLSSYFTQTANIDLSGYANWDPITIFTGSYDGDGYTISNLTINRAAGTQGLFGRVNSGQITNVILTNVSVTSTGYYDYIGSLIGYFRGTVTNCSSSGSVSGSGDYVGGLVGESDIGTLNGCSTSGTVTSTDGGYVGGLVGESYKGTITNCNSSCSVSGLNDLGGLIGSTYSTTTVTDCYSTGTVSGNTSYHACGGFVGSNWGATITECYATGNVTGGNSYMGGFVGDFRTGSISKCYATGNVDGNYAVGGFAGEARQALTNCYAQGSVTGVTIGGASDSIGGLIGYKNSSVTNCYSTGAVSGGTSLGGLVGYSAAGTVTSSYYDTTTSGQSDNTGKGEPKPTAQMKLKTTFSGWDFINVWTIRNGYPHFIWTFLNWIDFTRRLLDTTKKSVSFYKIS